MTICVADYTRFLHVSNLFHPTTIGASFDHNGSGPCGGIKDEAGDWNLAGHRDRLVEVDEDTLALFALLYDNPGTPLFEARLPSLHSRELVGVLRKLAAYPRRLGDLTGKYASAEMWHETNSVYGGIIRRETRFPEVLGDWILSGPHIQIANPLSKTPRRVCAANSHYDTLDLTELPESYLPRTNYVPACDVDTYVAHIPRVTWGDQKRVTDYFRLMYRAMLGQAGERTLISSLVPPKIGSIHTTSGFAFESDLNLVDFCSSSISLITDFWIKTTGAAFAGKALLAQLPIISPGKLQTPLRARTMLLNCLTSYYSDLWSKCWDPSFTKQQWTKEEPRLDNSRFSRLKSQWSWAAPLRTDYERRQALVEIDVLTAGGLGLTLDELCTIYRIQFPVLQQNERDTWYDQCGRIVFTSSKGLPGVGFTRPEWEDIKAMTAGVVTRTIQDDTLPGGPRERVIEYIAPFDRCDREADYTTAWKFFEENGE